MMHEKPNEGATNEWYTPKWILNYFSEFDLDPASSLDVPNQTANNIFTLKDDGLNNEWFGRVWLNPPYGRETSKFMAKMSDHGNGIALTFARVETRWFKKFIWDKANAILFLYKRVAFVDKHNVGTKPAPAPTCLIAYGSQNVEELEEMHKVGKFIRL